MNATTQMIVVAVVVLAAGVYVARSMWKTWAGNRKAGCGSRCGKCSASAPEAAPPNRISLPQV